ncbi:MAG: ribonuclease E activity regulator RraA [Parvibaculales bacterium]
MTTTTSTTPAASPSPTTDLSDAFSDDADAKLQYLAPGWRDFGGIKTFAGPARTLSTLDDNTKVRAQVESPGQGRVLVVDGGASMNCALFGGNLAQLAAQNGWAGIIINGCVRDTLELQAEAVGIKALATHPKKSVKRDLGELDVPLSFGGVTVNSGDWVYADEDGVLVAAKSLAL